MKRLFSLQILLLLSVMCLSGQVFTGKQAHALLDDIVMHGPAVLDTASVNVIAQTMMPSGGTLRCMVVATHRPETYVASYDANGKLIDGMMVATKGDVNVLQSRANNEYVWFVPQGEVECAITADSVVVTRNYHYEMKPIGDTYMRHCITVTSRYAVRPDGTFEQLEPVCLARQIEGQLDESGKELPATSNTAVTADFNSLSLNVMQLLHAPVSAHDTTMNRWAEMGLFFQQRTNMMGIPDADLWSAYYYKQSIHRLLMQGDGRNMVWFYRHHDEASANNMWLVMLMGYSSMGGSGATASWLFEDLQKAAKRLSDKEARQWWKKYLK